jgi:hypothetical protein
MLATTQAANHLELVASVELPAFFGVCHPPQQPRRRCRPLAGWLLVQGRKRVEHL